MCLLFLTELEISHGHHGQHEQRVLRQSQSHSRAEAHTFGLASWASSECGAPQGGTIGARCTQSNPEIHTYGHPPRRTGAHAEQESLQACRCGMAVSQLASEFLGHVETQKPCSAHHALCLVDAVASLSGNILPHLGFGDMSCPQHVSCPCFNCQKSEQNSLQNMLTNQSRCRRRLGHLSRRQCNWMSQCTWQGCPRR